jgi:hypothetical protein
VVRRGRGRKRARDGMGQGIERIREIIAERVREKR